MILVLGLVSHRVIDGREAQHIRWGQSSTIKLFFCIELTRMLEYVIGTSGPKAQGHRYSDLGQSYTL